MNTAEFSPSSDGNYPSSGGSPLPNKAQSPQNNFGTKLVCNGVITYGLFMKSICGCVYDLFNPIIFIPNSYKICLMYRFSSDLIELNG